VLHNVYPSLDAVAWNVRANINRERNRPQLLSGRNIIHRARRRVRKMRCVREGPRDEEERSSWLTGKCEARRIPGLTNEGVHVVAGFVSGRGQALRDLRAGKSAVPHKQPSSGRFTKISDWGQAREPKEREQRMTRVPTRPAPPPRGTTRSDSVPWRSGRLRRGAGLGAHGPPMLEAFAAIHGTTLGWLERNRRFLAAL
jgi:hypothetical protein